jgi:RNA polymerase sigma-70 factor (ECF subfamily)
LTTWLFTIAISRCRNKRRRKWLPLLPLEWLATESPPAPERAVEAALERRGVRRQVWAALQRLSPPLREAVVLRYLGGLHYKEIGLAVGCHPKTAESRVRLGVEAMRTSLRQYASEIESALAEWTTG